jgi:Zn-dependent peptidase ImmA (M78 family)
MEELNKITPPLPSGYEPIKKQNSSTPPLPSGYEPILKKKGSTQLTSQESLWGSNSQPKDAYTSLAIDQQLPQQGSDVSNGEQPKPILKGLPSVESFKKKSIQPKKEVKEIIKDVVPKVTKAISIEKGKEDFSEATQKARKESKSLVDKKQIDQKISQVSNLQNEYAKSLKDIELAKKTLSDEKAEIDYQLSIGNNAPEFKERVALHNQKVQENLDKFNLLKNKSEVINYNKKVIESASGNLLRSKAEQGNWFGAIYNKMLQSASSMASGAVSKVTDLIAEVVPSEYLIGPKELKKLQDKGLSQNQIDDYIKKSAKKDVLPAIRKGNVELFGDKGTTEEYIKKKESSGLIEGGVLGLAGSVPAMLGGVYGRATNFFLMGSDAVEQEMESNPDFQNISENEKLAVIVPIGIANAVLEEFGLQGVMKNNSLVNNLVHKTLLKVGADASASTFKRAMNNEIKSGIAAGIFKVGSGFTSEAITGGSQQAAEIGIKDIYNVVKDKKMFQTPETLSDAVSQISDAAIMEGIGGTVMSTLPAINTAMQNNELGKKSTDFEFEILDNINENSEEFKKLFTTDLKNKMIEGKITKDEAESQLKSFDKMTATFNRMPKDMSIEDKKKSFDLLVEKDKLTDEINGKDESLSTKQKERISEINNELSNISLGVKPKEEVKTEEVVTENKPKETATAQAYVEELTKTKESDPETYWSVSEVSAEDAAKGTIIDTTDGSALVKPDGDIAGLFKKPTSNAKGVAQDLLSKAVEAGGTKLDNFDGYLTKQYEKAGFRVASRTPFNEQYAPEGWNKEKHGTPDVVAMVYDPNNQIDIEEKTFEDYDQAIEYRDGLVDQVKTEVSDTQQLIDESEKSNDLPLLVEKAKTALSKVLPNVQVILHNTDAEYKAAVGESLSSGTYVDDVIHVNPSRANGRTVAHEVFHAVLLNKVKTDPEAQRITAKMITSVEKSLPDDMKLKLQQFVEEGYNSQEELWDEEKLAELIGFLADGYPSLSKPTQNVIKQWIDQLAKLFGLKEFTDADVVDFMNTLSGKVASGDVLTESDIKILPGGEKISNPFDYFKRKQVGAFDVQYTEQEKLDQLIKDKLVTKPENLDFLSGKETSITSPDDMLAGTISIDGKEIFEGGGGVFFVTKYGDVWASGNKGTANTLARSINNSYKKNGDKGYLVLAKGSDSKLISSASGVNSSLAVLDSMIDKGLISPSDFRSAVSESIKRFGGNISLNGSAKQLKEDVNNYFSDPKSSTFEVRGSVLGSIINSLAKSKNTKLNKDKIIEFLGGDKNKGLVALTTKENKSKNQSLSDLISGVAAEQLTKGLNVGDVYAVIEVDGEVMVKEDSHPSYPFHIVPVGKNKPVLHLPKTRQNGAELLTTSTGKPYKVGQVSIMSGSFNGPVRKQIIGEKAIKDKLVQDNLDVAKKMEAENKSAKDIFVATGWEKGADKKWKYDLQEGVVEIKSKKSGKASDVLNYPELFKAYPKAKDLDIVFMNSDKFEGMYLPSKNRIMISSDLSDAESTSTLLHELQHFVQHQEGFAVGGQARLIRDLYNERIKYEKNFSVKKVLNNIKNSLFGSNKNEADTKKELDKLGKLVSKVDEDLYRSIAGEVEAFNVEKRSTMTAEQRRATPISETADVPVEEQLVVSDSDTMLRDRKQSSLPIARLKKEGKTDRQISKFLQSKGLTVEKATEAILNYNKEKMKMLQKEEGIFTRDGRNKVITALDSFKRMFLSAKAFLGKSAFIAKENIEAGIKAQSKIASYLVNDLDVAIKNYDGDKEKVISDFDKFVRGEEVELPDNFLEIGNAMRDHIDKLSYELINSGIVDEYQAENIRKNIGTYLTRSYEVFDKKNWAEKVDQEVLQAAKNFLKKQLLSEATKEAKRNGLDVKSVLENKVDLAINDLIDREGAQSFISSGKTGSKDVSILKQKTDIPFEIRALMGEYTDPAQNYSRTIFKIASLINNAKFLNTVRDNGIGVYLFEKNDINRPKEFDTLIAAEGSETMNPLNGLYTTKEIAGSLKESAGILNSIEVALPFEVSSTVKSTYEYYMKLLSTVKWLKTVGSVGTHFKNVSGNITFMLANGYFKPDEYRKSAQVIHNDFFNKTDKELREKMQEYVDAGIVDQSAVLGELRSMFKDADFDKTFERRMNSEELNPSKKFIDKVKRLGKKGASLAENAYQAEDDYFKVISYETEKGRYAKAMYGKEYSKLTENQQDDVRKYVTEITKNVLPNYGRVPGAVKLVKAFPVVGTFISFQTEALRTAYNIVNLSVTELKSSNPDIKKIGALRMAGIISSQAVKYAMMYLIGGAVLGDDDDEKKEKAKRFVAPWSKNSNILIKNEGDGKFSYIDFSASDPFGGIVKPINAMMAGEDMLDGFIEGVKELVSPFTNPDILKSMFTEISENKDAYGNPLYNPSDSFEKKSEAILSRVYKTFEPGTVSSVRKIAESDGALNEMAGQFTGYKAKDLDLQKEFSFKISDMKKNEIEVRNIYNKAYNKFERKEISKEELQEAYNQSNKESKKLYEEFKKDYDAAIYFGTDAKILKKQMKRAHVSKAIIRSILTGKFKDMEKKKMK